MTSYPKEEQLIYSEEPDVGSDDDASFYDESDYVITPTSEHISFVRIVLRLGPTLNKLLLMAILAFFLAAVILYRAGFDVPSLLKHQIIIVSLILLIQSSVAANTFIIKQTVVNGNFTPQLQIIPNPGDDSSTVRGHLLFLSSLYKGSLYSTLFLTAIFSLLMFYSIYHVGSNIDKMTLYCFVGFVALNTGSSLLSFTQQKGVAKLLLSTPQTTP